jgi:hypothetical protein
MVGLVNVEGETWEGTCLPMTPMQAIQGTAVMVLGGSRFEYYCPSAGYLVLEF